MTTLHLQQSSTFKAIDDIKTKVKSQLKKSKDDTQKDICYLH
jgi:hypothetical protein